MTTTSKRRALIVGGSSGMGKATAKRLLDRGYAVQIVGRNVEKLAAAVDELSRHGEVTSIRADLRDESDVAALVERIDGDGAPYEALVNAAGTFSPKPFLEHTVEEYDAYHDLNRATFRITQAVARNMRTHGGGAIVNIGSMWAKQAVKATPSSAYSMAKAGLHALTQHLAMELADHGIRVNAVTRGRLNPMHHP